MMASLRSMRVSGARRRENGLCHLSRIRRKGRWGVTEPVPQHKRNESSWALAHPRHMKMG